MGDDRDQTVEQIIQRMNRLASRFYRENKAKFPQLCAAAFDANLIDFLEAALTWRNDLPQLHVHQRGEGTTQTAPSQNRLHVIKELEQLGAFLLENLERRPRQALKRSQLEGRYLLSVYACREFVRRSFGTLAVISPMRGLKRRGRLTLPEAHMLGWNSAANDVHRLKRSYAAASLDGSIKAYRTRQAYDRLYQETADRLLMASDVWQRHVPIMPLVMPMDRAAIANLALSSLLAARDLKTAFGLWDRQRDPQRGQTLTDFERPAPLYQFIMALLEQGWPCLSVPPDERQRLMAGERDHNSFEGRLSELVARVVEYMPQLARDLRQRNDFDPLVGIDARSIVKAESPPRRADRIEWEMLAPTAARRIAARIVKHREQIVILRDYAETLHRLNLNLAARAQKDDELKGDRDFFNERAVAATFLWVRECERQYQDGVFYPSDKRFGRDYLDVRRLNIDLLRSTYPTRQCQVAGPRFADVKSEDVQAVLDVHQSGVRVRRRLGRILSEMDS
jgi:hypothetical protein